MNKDEHDLITLLYLLGKTEDEHNKSLKEQLEELRLDDGKIRQKGSKDKNVRKQIEYIQAADEIIDGFDFDRVKKVMDFLDWHWAGCDGVPDVSGLRKEARRQLVEAAAGYDEHENELNGETWDVSSGGFHAMASRHEDGKLCLTLEFVVAEGTY